MDSVYVTQKTKKYFENSKTATKIDGVFETNARLKDTIFNAMSKLEKALKVVIEDTDRLTKITTLNLMDQCEDFLKEYPATSDYVEALVRQTVSDLGAVEEKKVDVSKKFN